MYVCCVLLDKIRLKTLVGQLTHLQRMRHDERNASHRLTNHVEQHQRNEQDVSCQRRVRVEVHERAKRQHGHLQHDVTCFYNILECTPCQTNETTSIVFLVNAARIYCISERTTNLAELHKISLKSCRTLRSCLTFIWVSMTSLTLLWKYVSQP